MIEALLEEQGSLLTSPSQVHPMCIDIDNFNELIGRYNISEEMTSTLRDLRRKGKNNFSLFSEMMSVDGCSNKSRRRAEANTAVFKDRNP